RRRDDAALPQGHEHAHDAQHRPAGARGRDVRPPAFHRVDRGRPERRRSPGDGGMTSAPAAAVAPPEPELTPAEVVARAEALRSVLVERQEETERLTYYPAS